MPLNPFRPGKPVPPRELIGRADPIRFLISNIHNMATAFVSGLPHIGKSSLLNYITDEKIRTQHLGSYDSRLHWQDFDCHLLPTDFSANDFWDRLFAQVETDSRFDRLKPNIERVRASHFRPFELSTFFKQCAYTPLGVVLVVDEFETLVSHPSFKDMPFFRTLRSLISNTDGLMMVTASRLRVAKLHERIREQMDGSPVFNTQMEICLPPFKDSEIDQLIDQSLAGSNVTFDAAARSLVVRLAGRHPYLVQVAASVVFEALLVPGTFEQRVDISTSLFRDRSDDFFADLWQYLEPEAQLALVILALAEANGHVHGRDYDTGDLAHLDWYTPELDKLAGLGLIDGESDPRWHADTGNFVLWHGQRWRFSAAGMIDWVLRIPVAEARKKDSFDQWLQRNQFEGLVTHAEKDKFKGLLKAVPEKVWRESGTFLGALAKGWMGNLVKGIGT